jgi:hypothetical protein
VRPETVRIQGCGSAWWRALGPALVCRSASAINLDHCSNPQCINSRPKATNVPQITTNISADFIAEAGPNWLSSGLGLYICRRSGQMFALSFAPRQNLLSLHDRPHSSRNDNEANAGMRGGAGRIRTSKQSVMKRPSRAPQKGEFSRLYQNDLSADFRLDFQPKKSVHAKQIGLPRPQCPRP